MNSLGGVQNNDQSWVCLRVFLRVFIIFRQPSWIFFIIPYTSKTVSGGARQVKRSLDSGASSLLALISMYMYTKNMCIAHSQTGKFRKNTCTYDLHTSCWQHIENTNLKGRNLQLHENGGESLWTGTRPELKCIKAIHLNRVTDPWSNFGFLSSPLLCNQELTITCLVARELDYFIFPDRIGTCLHQGPVS